MANNTRNIAVTVGGTTMSEVVSVTGPGYSKEVLDITALADSGRKFIAADVYDGGEVTIEAYGANTALKTAVTSTGSTALACSISYGAATESFNAFVTNYQPNAGGVGTAVTYSFTLKVTA